MTTNIEQWKEYSAREIATLLPLLERYGFTLEREQPHMGGERYLMQAITTASGKKLILLGKRNSDGKRVVLKATSDPSGIRELEHERLCRKVLHTIRFAYGTFTSPEEILFHKKNGFVLSVQAFIEQESTFLQRPLRDQFFLVLKAFKAQESAHATTYGHMQTVQKTFGSIDAGTYLQNFSTFKKNILAGAPAQKELSSILAKAEDILAANKKTVAQYEGFLTHTDFVPHNFRISNGSMYLLDYSSLRFGNKYEGWARFLNFMTLYNPELEKLLTQYVRDNRTPEESVSLHCMRIYRLGEIIWYYTKTLSQSTGNLLTLNTERITFWSEVLKAILEEKEVPQGVLEAYKKKRERLRSEDEKLRQKSLH